VKAATDVALMPPSPATLVIFDVDGTLTDSGPIDTEVNVAAMGALFGIDGVDTDWSRYVHATDAGIFVECFARRFGRPPDATERARFEQGVAEGIEEALRAAPERAAPVPGAAAMLQALAARPDVTLALASGAYERSMMAKLGAARLPVAHLPRASGSDGVSREEIVAAAVARARAATRSDHAFARVVSVGDGPWDLRTARALDIEFVGVGKGPARARLAREGASQIVDDYLDLVAFTATIGI
jgi:phosphoglycolate phosphatase-like HAD superfamily hydrolase